MSYEERIRTERPGMSKSFARLADYLLDSYIEASFMTASELAHALNLDAATVVRFSQHLGYKGYPELLREIRDKVRRDLLIRPRQAQEPSSVPGVVAAAMQSLGRELDQTRISLDTDALSRLVEEIGQARRIIILAEAPAQPAAYNLLYFLEQGGFQIYIARPGVVDLARTIHTAQPNDLLLAMDVSGTSPNIQRALREARQRGIRTATVAGAASLPSTRPADVVLSALERPSIQTGVLIINVIIYVLVEVLRWTFAERFTGAEQAIAELTEQLQIDPD
ncbi:MAG: MurR/RpiR family transcriptional regulator [Anaerolineales bacterium]|jgi:DNA-binding MurR/RpiR family transcriptional regulator|nr:MurR/RpiR family transcriptional regulator [Anaerolineales bacterium]